MTSNRRNQDRVDFGRRQREAYLRALQEPQEAARGEQPLDVASIRERARALLGEGFTEREVAVRLGLSVELVCRAGAAFGPDRDMGTVTL
jgi:hypothetical protein